MSMTTAVLIAFHFKKGCVRTVGRTPFPSPQHPNAVYCCHSCYAKYRWDNKVFGDVGGFPRQMFSERGWVRWTTSPSSKCLDPTLQSRPTQLSWLSGRFWRLYIVVLCNKKKISSFKSNPCSSMSFSRAIIQQPSKFFVENRSKLFEEHDKEYGTKEAGEWRFEGTETLYKGLFNLVCSGLCLKWVRFHTFTFLPGEPHGRVDPLKGDGNCHQVCRAAQVVQTHVRFNIIVTSSSPQVSYLRRLFWTELEFFGKPHVGASFPWPAPHNLPVRDQLQSARSNPNLKDKMLIPRYFQHIWHKCLGIYQAEGVIEAGKKLPIVDVGSGFYPNMVRFRGSSTFNNI